MSEIDFFSISARDLAGLIGSHLASEGIDDRQALQQAIWVAKDQRGEYDLDAIRAWSENEGEPARFDEFISLLNTD